jgi:hypothetical protein
VNAVAALRKCVVGLGSILAIGYASAQANPTPAHIAQEISDAQLIGEGQFRWFGFKVYDAQLWAGKTGFTPVMPTTEKFALDFRYALSLQGKKIAESGIKEIEKLGFGTPQQREQWLHAMEACFSDVETGMHLTGVFEPGIGASFYRDGKKTCDINDAEFGAAFFAIWLDPRTTATHLREQLLAHMQTN